jgi:uncharacterized protein (DUF58 family)
VSLRLAGICLAALIGLIAIAGDWSSDLGMALLWRLPAGLLLAGLAYESWMVARARLKLKVEVPELWFLGRPAVARFSFTHATHRSMTLEIAPSAPDDFAYEPAVRSLAVAPATAACIDFACTARRLGSHRWSPARVRIAGPLGLAWWSKRVSDQVDVRVQPELLIQRAGVAGAGPIGARSGRSVGSGTELLQLRAYRRGDPPRVVDWKATARARRLISRDFSEDQHLEILILIDAGRSSGLRSGGLDRFGHYVNVASRLAQYAVSQDDLVGVVVFAERPLLECPPARGAPAVARIRRLLSRARVVGNESDPLQAAIRVRSLVRQRSLVVVLTDLDDAAVAGQLAAAVRLLLPKHLPFVAGLSSSHAESMAGAPAHRWPDPYRSLAAQEYCASLNRKVESLKARGAPSLVAKPEQLESAVLQAYADFRRRRRI